MHTAFRECPWLHQIINKSTETPLQDPTTRLINELHAYLSVNAMEKENSSLCGVQSLKVTAPSWRCCEIALDLIESYFPFICIDHSGLVTEISRTSEAKFELREGQHLPLPLGGKKVKMTIDKNRVKYQELSISKAAFNRLQQRYETEKNHVLSWQR